MWFFQKNSDSKIADLELTKSKLINSNKVTLGKLQTELDTLWNMDVTNIEPSDSKLNPNYNNPNKSWFENNLAKSADVTNGQLSEELENPNANSDKIACLQNKIKTNRIFKVCLDMGDVETNIKYYQTKLKNIENDLLGIKLECDYYKKKVKKIDLLIDYINQ